MSPGYWKFWTSDTVSAFGTHISAVALPALAIFTMDAGSVQVGLLNGARWLPYLLFGLFAGVIADRYRRRPILIATDFGRFALLALIAVLALFETLNIYGLMAFVMVLGVLSLLYDAAHQSYLPRLVPAAELTTANTRLSVSVSVAQTTGPFLGGAVVSAIGAPLALLADAVSYVVSGLILWRIKLVEPPPSPVRRSVFAEIREGLHWIYKHPMLAPYALSNHTRFLFSGALGTILTLFVTRGLQPGLSEEDAAFGLGLVLALGGVGAVLGNSLGGWAGNRLGTGRAVVASRLFEPFAWALIPLAVTGWLGWTMVGAAQFLIWFALGVGGPNEMSYRQSVTPDGLQGRMNATIRSMNWGMVTIGAIGGGFLVERAGYRPALWIAIAGMAAAALGMALSPYRHARIPVTAAG